VTYLKDRSLHKVCSTYIHLCLWENILIGQSCGLSCCGVWCSSDLEILPFLFEALGDFVLIKMLQNHSITYSSIGEQFLPKPNMISGKIKAFYIRCLLLCWVWSSLVDPCWEIYYVPRSRSRTPTYTLHRECAKTCFHLDLIKKFYSYTRNRQKSIC
jgi:hypothetical protein